MSALDAQEANVLALAGDAVAAVDHVTSLARRLNGRVGASTLQTAARHMRTTAARSVSAAALLERMAREVAR